MEIDDCVGSIARAIFFVAMETMSPEHINEIMGSQEEAESSLDPKRKHRLRQYVKDRAASCFELASESNHSVWKSQDIKQQVIVYKPVNEWNGYLSSKAVITANASFSLIPRILAELSSTTNFKTFLRKILGDYLMDAQVLEELEQVADISPEDVIHDETSVFAEQAAIKWWAIKSCPLASKPSDFYVLEVYDKVSIGKTIFYITFASTSGLKWINTR